nr:MAG: hypothetical protein [Caudoviricetes sp.]
MKTPADIIIELESDNSRLFKESVIIREMAADNVEFFNGVKYACDRLISFGVNEKTIPYKDESEVDVDHIKFSEFELYIEKLIKREITGNAAKDLLLEICNKTSHHTWNNWYRRILLKDLKCGVSETTINNCAKKVKVEKYKVPVFSCQLAFDSKQHDSKLFGKKIIECKLDGSRVLTLVYPDGRVQQFSRNGKEILNFNLIKDQFSLVAKTVSEPMVFDGEIMSSSFQDLMTQFYRKENVNTSDANLYIFDMIPLSDFIFGVRLEKQIYRTENLHKWYDTNRTLLSNVKVLQYEIVDLDTEIGKTYFEEINRKAIEEGYEGIMIKDPQAPYECKRSTAWLKLKPVMTVDLEVIGLEEGKDKYEGMLGALICRGFDGNKEIFVNVGSGLTDEERIQYWSNKTQIIGKIAEIKCDAITQNQEGTYSLRFPRFVRLRGFLVGEKI